MKTMGGGVESLMVKLSSGGLDGVIKALLDRFVSADFAKTLGFEKLHHAHAEFLQNQDRVVVDSMWRLVVGLIGHLAATSMYYKTPPFSFARLRSKDAVDVRQCLQELRHGFESLERMEQETWLDVGCKDFVGGCLAGLHSMRAKSSCAWPSAVGTRIAYQAMCSST